MNKINEAKGITSPLILLIMATPFAGGQTRVDLQYQSKGVDFSRALSTKPAQVGTVIPVLCSTGQIFFDANSVAGQNLYGCTATNTWTLLGGTSSGSGAALATQLGDFAATNSSSTVQTLGGCSTGTPCEIRDGATVFSATVPVSATLGGTGTSGTVFWYVSSQQIVTAGHNSAATITCSAGCSVVLGITAFPSDSIPLWQTTFTGNVWDPISFATMDRRAVYSRNVLAGGSGVLSATDPSSGTQTFTVDPTVVPRYFTGSGAPSANCTAGRDFYTDTTGLNLYFCDAANTWKVGGIGMLAQAGDFAATNSSATVQTIGANCSASAPCQAGVGNAIFTMVAPATATIGGTSANDTIYWYSDGTALYAGYNGAETITCAGCTALTGITAFPVHAVPLWATTITANAWNTIAGAMDKRRAYSAYASAAGSGITISNNSATGVDTFSIDATQVPRYFTGAGAPSSTCTAGRDFYTDTTNLNLYFCDATNTWKQANNSAVSAPFWAFGRSTATTSTSALSAGNKISTWLFSVDYPRTFSGGVSLYYTNDGAHTAFAIYNLAGSLLYSTATRTGSATATQATLNWGSSFTLQPGDYYLAFTSDTTTARIAEINDSLAQMATVDNNSGTLVYGTCANSSTGSAALTFPSTCGTQAALSSAPPYVIFK